MDKRPHIGVAIELDDGNTTAAVRAGVYLKAGGDGAGVPDQVGATMGEAAHRFSAAEGMRILATAVVALHECRVSEGLPVDAKGLALVRAARRVIR